MLTSEIYMLDEKCTVVFWPFFPVKHNITVVSYLPLHICQTPSSFLCVPISATACLETGSLVLAMVCSVLHIKSEVPQFSTFFGTPCLENLCFYHNPKSFSAKPGLFCNECLAFGFDSHTNDYKVLGIVQFCNRELFKQVFCGIEIYSLSAGSWRNISNIASSSLEIIWPDSPVVFFNGFLHYVAFQLLNNNSNHSSAGFCNHVLAFDVGYEIFCKSVCQSLAGVHPSGISICVYKESITVVDHNVSASQFCAWVMGEYGIGESWTRLLVVNLKEHPENTRYAELQAFSTSGQLVLHTIGYPKENSAGCLHSYDPETKIFGVMHFWWKDYDVFLCSYVELSFAQCRSQCSS